MDRIVTREHAITLAMAAEMGDDPSNVEPGSWVMATAVASTIADIGNLLEAEGWDAHAAEQALENVQVAMSMLGEMQRMIADETIGLVVS